MASETTPPNWNLSMASGRSVGSGYPYDDGEERIDRMIARIWHGMVPVSKGDDYLELMRRIALPEYLSTRGNRGAWCLRRTEADVTHFEMLTFWEDTDAIKRFAGDNYNAAKYYDFDPDYLIELEVHVRHFEVYSETSLHQVASK